MTSEYRTVVEMAKDFELSPVQYMVEALGWEQDAAEVWLAGDAYTMGYCGRCGRVRRDCQAIIEAGNRCTDKGVN